jgi:hypothetical protein
MYPRRMVLDFEGRRLQGARPFAVFDTKDGAWTWYSNQPHLCCVKFKRLCAGVVSTSVLVVQLSGFWRMIWRDKSSPARFCPLHPPMS